MPSNTSKTTPSSTVSADVHSDASSIKSTSTTSTTKTILAKLFNRRSMSILGGYNLTYADSITSCRRTSKERSGSLGEGDKICGASSVFCYALAC
ncbi:hypothetical protein P153DRAFT_110043 [Dothidotthia symphoricarpi CBS 119687]|uniref:Uncharacterized protein n=1 Tax=Dothidotthia symphoricarpi CBS 119687 TaxID=1392245 RepID=A0A6A6AQR6_9PLEO|nr:uncharacterized protein P153DRAFT_110043 [Dothidotthia symphoricarpi CBS 119687]KAF2134332.1 hypothetical protein P153DRAFT_110043 [Dothidotthia symphoricarpi CBS 119687]